MKKRILVLGGNGFIGCHLVEELALRDVRLRVLARSKNQHVPPVKGVEYRYANFSDSIDVAEALVDVDIVVHLISTTVPATANLDPAADIKGNLLPTISLLQQMHELNVPRLVFISSGGTVYGDAKVSPIPENHIRNPLSSYGIVKVAIENYISMFSSQYGLKSLILRVSNPYGPRQGHIGIQGVIPTFFHRILSGEEIKIWGDGTVIRDYLYIDDLIGFITKSIEKNLVGIYNVGSGQGTALKDVLSIIENVTNIKAKVNYLPPRGYDVKNVVLDITNGRNALDWTPQISLHEGCIKYWQWVKRGSSGNRLPGLGTKHRFSFP
ncbi:MAG: NAD-dependent epimerase/dehydratase family protein [Desulfobulbaceae bacterium]|nr:NAD-dependent epimerase/dehydratase family protein [Desulfobulbaceae bacterium]